MPKPSLRVRSKKLRQKRSPGGVVKNYYKRGRNNSATCSTCHRKLSGVPQLIRKVPKSRRRPDRLFGGQICHECLRILLKQAVRRG